MQWLRIFKSWWLYKQHNRREILNRLILYEATTVYTFIIFIDGYLM